MCEKEKRLPHACSKFEVVCLKFVLHSKFARSVPSLKLQVGSKFSIANTSLVAQHLCQMLVVVVEVVVVGGGGGCRWWWLAVVVVVSVVLGVV